MWIVLLLFYFLPRFSIFLLSSPWEVNAGEEKILINDAKNYNRCALNILKNRIFSNSEKFPLSPEAHITPGYPFYIAVFYYIFGEKPWVILLSQILLQSFLLWGMWLLVKMFGFSFRTYFIGATIVSLDSVNVITSMVLIPDSIFSLIILFSFIYLLKIREQKLLKPIFVSTLLLSTGIYFKPGARFIILVWSILIFILKEIKLKEKLKGVGLLWLVCFISILPWMARNYKYFGHLSFSYHIYEHLRTHAKEILVEKLHVSEKDADFMINQQLKKIEKKRSTIRNIWNRAYKRYKIYKEIILGNWLLWGKLTVRDAFLVYILPSTSRYIQLIFGEKYASVTTLSVGEFMNLLREKGLINGLRLIYNKKSIAGLLFVIIISILNFCLFFGAGVGAIYLFRLNTEIFWIIIITLGLFSLSIGPVLDPRYKLTFFWLFALLSGLGIDRLFYLIAKK